jgi:hypothetical protein
MAPEAPWPQVAPMAPMPPMPNVDLDFDFDFDFNHNIDLQDRMAEADARMAEARDRMAETQDRMVTLQAKLGTIDGLKAPIAFAQNMALGWGKGSDDRLYQNGQRALENRQWDQALGNFNQVVSRGGSRADGALYWKAYTLSKLGRRDEALAAIAELRKSYASSRWLDDAKALELEVRQASGQNVAPESESDEDLKLMALNGIMQSDPDRALPLVEKLLKGAASPKLKKNAVFVLAQSTSPKGQQLLEQIARGGGNPDLQLVAIRYLGETRRKQGNSAQLLAEIYASSGEAAVKREILNAFASSRDKDRILQVAKTEKDPELRLYAIRLLGGSAAQAELWQLYQAETSVDVKRQILESLASGANSDKLLEVAKTEKDATLRRTAIRELGGQRAGASGEALAALYGSEQDTQVKRTIVETLYSQRNAKGLVVLARAEKDPQMKRDIVRYLTNMKSPEATDYLMEILK